MIRHDEWDKALSRAVRSHATQPGQWGVSDCLTFPRDCVEAMTGERLFPKVKYTTEKGAALAMKRLGFATIGDLIASVLPEQPRLLAGRGDVVTVEVAGETRGGVVTGSGVAVKTLDGLVYLPLAAITRAFKVG